MTSARNGKIVTFYSYKGGTGRTMALANVAWILASNGKRVLAVDWDLESPGLHKFFHPFLDESAVAATPGIIEIISDYAMAVPRVEERSEDWHLDYARILPHAVSLDWTYFRNRGTLDFISAGRQNRDYSALVSFFDWDNFYDRLGGGQFFDAMRADMKRNYDYVLIDSRTGLSDIADICTVQFPDILVDCFTLNDQSIDGASAVARRIADRYHDRNVRILPVPMRIEDGEKEKLDVGRALARAKFDRFPADLSPDRHAQYWGSVEIPYKPYYAFEETLATFGDEPGSPTSLLAAFERLTAAITDDEIGSMPPLPEDIRLRFRRAFTRRRPMVSSKVFVSYAPEDRMWADWIDSLLTRSGMRVMLHNTTASAQAVTPQAEGDLAEASHAVALLSSAYLRSPGAAATWEAVSAADRSATRRQLVPIRIDEVRLTAPFFDHQPVDVAGLPDERASAVLMRALGRAEQAVRYSAGPVEGEPRFPGAVPAVWNVPGRNPEFTGRNTALEMLRDQLMGSGTAVVLAQALYGLGGVGKTQIALEYAHRFKADYDLVWWVPAGSSNEINQSLADLAGRMGIHIGENLTEAAHDALEALRRSDPGRRWLLVFDNADDPKELQPYLPSGPGHVIITSRNHSWNQLAAPLEVDVFTREESMAHLLQHVPGLDPTDADRVASALGDLPLAVEQAGAWLQETGTPSATYVEQLETELMRTLNLTQPSTFPASAVATWNMSIELLRVRSPASIRLLQLCAFCSPGPISMSLLYSDEMIQSLLPFDESLIEPVLLGRVIREISRFALVKVDQASNSIQIHRLVQAVIRSQMTEEAQNEARHEVHKILCGIRPGRGDTGDTDAPENWPAFNAIWPHLMPSLAAECKDERTRQLLIDWVRYLWKRGEFDVALNLASQLETLWTERLGADHRQTLHLRFHIGNLLRSRGLFLEARELNQHVLARQRQVLPANHPHTLMTASGLAADLRALGEFQEALNADQDTYNRLKDQFGEDHPRTLSVANNLAVSLRLVGDCFAAQALDRETLRRRRLVLGPNHPETLYSAASLARDMREAGAFAESVELLRTTHDGYRAVLGEEALDTLRTAKSLAVSLRKAGEQIDAKRLTEETYGHYLQRYGADSPDALSCQLNLACDYSALEDKARARDLVMEVMAAYRGTLGEDHPYTLVAASNLVTYLRGTDAVDEAAALGEQTQEALRVRLGADHPFTMSCSVNLADCLHDARRLDGAEALLRETAALLQRKLGTQHPDTLVCEANLAVALHAADRLTEAEELRERVMADLGRVLGQHHPDTGRLLEWRLSNRDLEPQPT
jgi:tetratricopeptide (TPR) repeat protein